MIEYIGRTEGEIEQKEMIEYIGRIEGEKEKEGRGRKERKLKRRQGGKEGGKEGQKVSTESHTLEVAS